MRSLPTRLFFHINGKEFIEQKKLFPEQQINYIGVQGFFREKGRFNIDIDKPIPIFKNTVVGTIMIAVYMGFEEIYLLGCEHNFLASPNPYGYGHFYEEYQFDIKSSKDLEYSTIRDKSFLAYEQRINQISALFRNYRLLKTKLASNHPSVKIYNATPNSFLDVFPAVNFEDIRLF